MKITISEKRIWLFVVIALLSKITYFIYYKMFISGTVFGGGNDSDYYNAYALGVDYVVVNFWPVILRFLNEMGYYNRNVISWITFVISITLQPYVYYKMVKIQADEIKPVMAGSFFLIVFYPTMFYLTIDIFREVYMFIALLLCLLLYKKFLETNWPKGFVYIFIYVGLTFFLFLMRPYLGFALALTPFVYLIFLKTKRYVKTWVILYFVTLILVKNFGGIDEILIYREGFRRFDLGGSGMGIGLLNKGPIMFLFYYLYTLVGQLFGLFLVNLNSIIVFLFESVPFILAFIYLSKNIKFMNRFVSFLITFFVIYTTIWLLGNDNLGTAVRLRIPSYLVIFASMFIVYQTKVVIGYAKTNNRDL